MSDQTPPDAQSAPPPPPPTAAPVPPPPNPYEPAQAYGGPPVSGPGPLGKVRSTGLCFLWMILTIGIYGFFWIGYTHGEMKRHTGQGIGGPLAVVIWFFVSPVMFFLTPNEVGNMQQAAGRPQTVSAITGLWILLPLAGPIVWFVKNNSALNEYWRSLGAPA